ncbi:MAG: hypothetical protein WB785_18290, partial [Mycobacterium sp.]|uniref:hypothetical protein n=1 Tax=Mycobacterium sp. TaxID=1785 RepID=UPI003C488DB1
TPPAFVLSQDQNLQTKTTHKNRERIQIRENLTKARHQKLASKNHVPTRGVETRQKNNNKNKTTKHTIEFSNNTREQATLPLYSAAQGRSTRHRSAQDR